MLRPGPDHPIMLERPERRWRAFVNGHVIADSNEALILREAGLPPAVYFPRADVAMEYMGRSKRHTTCPYKGEAAYYTLTIGGEVLEDVAWSFEEPTEAVSPLAGRIAFDPEQIRVYAVDDAVVNPARHDRREEVAAEEATFGEDLTDQSVDEVILHTDSGGGVSQREHWPPNVESPRPEGGLR